MLYRLFVYKSAAASTSVAEITNAVISADPERKWEERLTGSHMEHFEAEEIKKRIEAELGNECSAVVCYLPKGYEKVEFLYITATYANIRKVLPPVQAIAVESGLVLYDAETEKFFYDAFVTIRISEQKFEKYIPQERYYTWSFQKIQSFWNGRYWDYVGLSNLCYRISISKKLIQCFPGRFPVKRSHGEVIVFSAVDCKLFIKVF